MRNKQIWSGLGCLFMIIQACAQSPAITSAGMGKIQASFRLQENGIPQYSVYFDQRPVITWSGLGFILDSDSSFYRDFELIGTEKRSADETWQPVWGEVKNIRNHY